MDEQVYRKIMAEKHRMERAGNRRVSMSQALRSLMARLKYGELGDRSSS